MIVTNRRALVALVAALALTGCAKPPAEAIAAADAAQQAAVAAEAEQYAPEAMNSVAEAKAALDAEIAAQGEKMSLTRSYKRAEELVAAYKAAAEQATTAVHGAVSKPMKLAAGMAAGVSEGVRSFFRSGTAKER